jgi:hypothetical protein
MGKKKVNEYSEASRAKAFQYYCETENCRIVADKMNIAESTIKTWKDKYEWDKKIGDRVKSTMLELVKTHDELEKIIDSIDEAQTFQKIGESSSLDMCLKLPSAISNPLQSAKLIGDEGLDLLITKNWMAREFATTQLLESLAMEALRKPSFKPKTFKDVLSMLKLAWERNDKIRERLERLLVKNNKAEIIGANGEVIGDVEVNLTESDKFFNPNSEINDIDDDDFDEV